MKILYFHFYFTTKEGAAGTRSFYMAKKLADRGHDVTVACASYALSKSGATTEVVGGMRKGRVENFNVIEFVIPYAQKYNYAKRMGTFLAFAWRAIKLARTMEYDLLFSTSTPLTAGLPGIFMKKSKRKRPFVFEVRDLWPELPREMGVIKNPMILDGLAKLERDSYKAADAGIGLSPGIVDGMERGGMKRDLLTMIPNGCDLELFQPTDEKRIDLPGIEANDFVALFCGAHGRANGLDAVLDAARVLKDRGVSDVKFVFIGDGGLKPSLVQRVETEELTNCLFFDPIPKVKLAETMARAHVGLMCLANVPAFYYGTSPNKFFDYLACGIPILVNYPGWMAELVQKHDCGVSAPPEDAAAFADALMALKSDPERQRRAGANARRLGEQEFDWDRLSDRFAETLEAAHSRWTGSR